MSTTSDYYEVLGVSKGAGVDEIKKSYRKLVMQHHPDRVSGEGKKVAEEKFKEISEAYAVLSDPKKKQLYDQYGHAGIDSRYSTEDIFRGADFSSIFGSGGGGVGNIFESIFSDFGFGGSSRGSAQGEDIQLQLNVSLHEAASGIEKDITYQRYNNCKRCRGSGAEPGSKEVTCSYCKGRGTISSGLGFINFSQTCPTCGGRGKVVKDLCRQCSGKGRMRANKNLKVTIPKGVDNGSVLRLKAEGNEAPAGRGDLYLYIGVMSDSVFTREGDNVRCNIKISVLNAILGAEIEVPTLEGKAKMKVPAGTQPNTVFRLKGKGITNLRTKRPGDELVEVKIEIPKRLSARERKAIGEWAKLYR